MSISEQILSEREDPLSIYPAQLQEYRRRSTPRWTPRGSAFGVSVATVARPIAPDTGSHRSEPPRQPTGNGNPSMRGMREEDPPSFHLPQRCGSSRWTAAQCMGVPYKNLVVGDKSRHSSIELIGMFDLRPVSAPVKQQQTTTRDHRNQSKTVFKPNNSIVAAVNE